jgi:hypothetical protein
LQKTHGLKNSGAINAIQYFGTMLGTSKCPSKSPAVFVVPVGIAANSQEQKFAGPVDTKNKLSTPIDVASRFEEWAMGV